MKNKLTSVVLSILLHLGLAGALLYAHTQKPEQAEPAQAINITLVVAPQPKAVAKPAPEPVPEPIQEVVEAMPSPAPKPEPKKIIAKATPKPVAAKAKPKPVTKKKIVTTNNKQAVVSKPKKKARNPEEEKWAELLQPVKASKPTPVTTSKQASKPSRNTRQTKVAARPPAAPVVRKAAPSQQAKQTTSNYKPSLRRLIERQKKYPSRARRRGDEGVVVVSFVVSASGQISNVKVKTSSGSRILDNAAMNTVKKVSGKLPFSADIQQRQLAFNVPLTYRLR